MTEPRSMAAALRAIGVALLIAGMCQAQPFVDDFEDGNAEDGAPVTWLPMPGFESGLRYVLDGSYVLEPESSDINVVSSSYAADRNFTDVSIRSQLRWTGPVSSYSGIGLGARASGNESAWSLYAGGIGTNGNLFISEILDGYEEVRTSRQTTLNPIAGDVHLQFDVIGTSLSLYAWQDGMSKPAEPQLQLTDNTLSSGAVGIGMRPSTNRAPVALRFYEAVPEPSSGLLAFLGLLGLAALAKRDD